MKPGIIRRESQENLYYINRHKDLFDIEPSPLLVEFEAFAGWSRDWSQDCSCKVEGGRVLPARFYLARHHPQPSDHLAVRELFRRVGSLPGCRLDYRWIDRFFTDRDDLAKVDQVLVAIDARRDEPTLKYGVWLGDDPAYRDRAVAMLGNRPGFRDQLALVDWWQVAFSLRLDGQSAMELYLSFKDPGREPSRGRLAGWLPPIARRWPEESEVFGLGVETGRPHNVVYLIPRDPDTFISRLGNAAAQGVHAHFRGVAVINPWVGFPEERLIEGTTDALALQYTVRLEFLTFRRTDHDHDHEDEHAHPEVHAVARAAEAGPSRPGPARIYSGGRAPRQIWPGRVGGGHPPLPRHRASIKFLTIFSG